jgi:PHD/YefM family antitoxin component YafN of YafNO toxin-antitoxin module
MNINVTYLTDNRGKPQAVQISYADWEKVRHELQLNETRVSLEQAFSEINAIENGQRPVVNLHNFLADWDKEPAANAD